jgi:gas vesicle protein
MSDSRDTIGSSMLFFLLGTAVGALVVALTTPKTGPELRANLKDMGSRIRERARRMTNDIRIGEEDLHEDVTKG